MSLLCLITNRKNRPCRVAEVMRPHVARTTSIMADLERVIGPRQLARLVRGYRNRLTCLDLLHPDAADRLAAYAYGTGNVYVVAAPGQVWETVSENVSPERITVREIDNCPARGPVAIYDHGAATDASIPLNALDTLYQLVAWPSDQTLP
ncbi:hypothetical protein [Streptacidiphilus rugosus]|uniref:hypothetical protein n=1 Tax=Streptacidiphilus rugosus TaxID=405783 RepID=UPI000569CA6B|nr:hypothetical protein [Streptacidiphilus rugosus]